MTVWRRLKNGRKLVSIDPINLFSITDRWRSISLRSLVVRILSSELTNRTR